jgi:transcriptional regulator with XRE-family HTH domain
MQKLTTCKCCKGTGQTIDHRATGEEFRKRREALKLTQKQLAKALRISPPYVLRLETGQRAWSEELIRSYETVLERAQKPATALKAALR